MTFPTRMVIRPHLLLDVVTGELLTGRAVVIEGRRIAAVVAAGDAPAEGAAFVDLPGQTVLPGMIDCHTHLVGEPDGGQGYAALLSRTGAQEALSGVRNARNTLLGGFTTVRDVGTFRAFVDVALRDAIDQGWVPGPRMRVAGAYVTCSGGGGDITGLAPDVDVVVPHEFRIGVADSVDDMRRAVRRVLHGGADFVKLIATGAVMAPGGVPGAPELTEEQIRAAVEEASLCGADVAAHAHGAEGIKRAVRGGVRSIEHGSLMDDESIGMMAAAGTFLVADVYNGDYIAETGRAQGWRADVLAKNDQTTVAQREGFTKCLAAGVRIAFGTDSGIYPHGLGARQFAYQVRCGQSPLGAIQSATIHAAELIRWDDRVGRIAPGYLADLIAVNGNPLQDIHLLENTVFVMKDGTIHHRCPDTTPGQAAIADVEPSPHQHPNSTTARRSSGASCSGSTSNLRTASGRIVHGYCGRVDDRALAATVASCKDLIDSRFPEDGDHGAAAMLLADGTILTGTAPDAVNACVEVCHEIEPYCGAYRLNQRVVASVCLHRRLGGRTVVLSPCGVCRERLAVYGPGVLVAVADRSDPTVVVWKTLGAVLPDYWMTAFPDEIDAGWT